MARRRATDPVILRRTCYAERKLLPIRAASPEDAAPPPSESEPAPEAVAPVEDNAPTFDLDALWQKAVEQIRARRPLIKGWIDSAKFSDAKDDRSCLVFRPNKRPRWNRSRLPRNREFPRSDPERNQRARLDFEIHA